MFDRVFGFRKFYGATFCRFQQSSACHIAQGTLAGRVRYILVKAWLFSLLVVMVVVAVAAAAGGGGMFGHRVTVLRASI